MREADTNRTPLHYCAERGYQELTRFLVERAAADINAVDREGWTPLHVSCSSGYTELTYYLLKSVRRS